MSQMNYADRQLETALTAMFEQKVAANRSTLRYWPAVSDRLGEQVSRRPWEYVMDAINRPRVPFNTRYIYAAGSAMVVVIAVLLLVLLLNTDDGASGESVPADVPEQIVPDADSEPASGVFDPDAEAEIIRLRFDQRWEAFRVQDWDSYRVACLESQRDGTPNAELTFSHASLLAQNDQSPEGFSLQILEVTVTTPLDALVQYQLMEFAEPVTESRALIWTNVDDNWFSMVCSPGLALHK